MAKTKTPKAPKTEATSVETVAPAPVQRSPSPVAYRRAANLLKQAADPTRLSVLMTLAEGEKNVGELCEIVGQSQPACSHHLALMRHGQLIEPRRAGKSNYYQCTDEGRTLADAVRGLIQVETGHVRTQDGTRRVPTMEG